MSVSQGSYLSELIGLSNWVAFALVLPVRLAMELAVELAVELAEILTVAFDDELPVVLAVTFF